MNEQDLRQLLESYRSGELDADAMVDRLRHLPFEDLGFARVDHHRALRHGFPEVIFGPGKTPEQVTAIARRLAERAPNVLITRAGREQFEHLQAELGEEWEYEPAARAITRWRDRSIVGKGTILVITAGTSDLPVAEEAAITARITGNTVEMLSDVGVAGIHRLLHSRERIFDARVVIAVAGMEGALPSVVGGLARCPVIAVPTSVGYGASFGGIAALLGMLNSCSSNVVTVNIDNGFGAGYVASLINRLA